MAGRGALAATDAPHAGGAALAAAVLGWRADGAAEDKLRALLLDTVGCALGGRTHAGAARAAGALGRVGAGDVATGLLSGARQNLIGAVFDSGAAIRALDLNDFYWGPGIGGHPSDAFAALLPLAEAEDRTLADLIAAAAVAYELSLRLLDRMAPDGAFDHCTATTLGAIAGGALLLSLDPERLAHALALGVTQGPTMIAVRYGAISEGKGLAAPLACAKAVLALELAAAGLTGPVAEAFGPRGLAAVLREPDFAALAAPFAGRVADVAIKRYACIGTAQTAVAAAAAAHRAAAAHGGITSASVRLADSAITRHQTTAPYRRPDNRETADHSFFALVALALADGEVTPRQFAARRWADPDVAALVDRISFGCDLAAVPDGRFPAEIATFMADGTTFATRVEAAPGHPRNPLCRDALLQKFHGLARPAVGRVASEALASLCLDGDGDVPVRSLVAMVRP